MNELTLISVSQLIILTIDSLAVQKWGIIVIVSVIVFLTYWFSDRTIKALKLRRELIGRIMRQVKDLDATFSPDGEVSLEMARIKEKLENLIQRELSSPGAISAAHLTAIEELREVTEQIYQASNKIRAAYEMGGEINRQVMKFNARKTYAVSQKLQKLSDRYQEVYPEPILEEVKFYASQLEGMGKRYEIRSLICKDDALKMTIEEQIKYYSLMAEFIDSYQDTLPQMVLELSEAAKEIAIGKKQYGELTIAQWKSKNKNFQEKYLNKIGRPSGEKFTSETFIRYKEAEERYVSVGVSALSKIENERKFLQLVEQWRRETYTSPNPGVLISHPAYQEIIKMGKPVIPLILREMEHRPAMWFTALKTITGENPILPEIKGDTRKMREAWLTWGKDQGYRW